jgi:hypothetical protein
LQALEHDIDHFGRIGSLEVALHHVRHGRLPPLLR